ncbi:MAG TPA: hypothetical protein VD947_04865 [Patescibacteria group bacterium]|nr:hypothetical protein [Patescibacteria group bacterium]
MLKSRKSRFGTGVGLATLAAAVIPVPTGGSLGGVEVGGCEKGPNAPRVLIKDIGKGDQVHVGDVNKKLLRVQAALPPIAIWEERGDLTISFDRGHLSVEGIDGGLAAKIKDGEALEVKADDGKYSLSSSPGGNGAQNLEISASCAESASVPSSTQTAVGNVAYTGFAR